MLTSSSFGSLGSLKRLSPPREVFSDRLLKQWMPLIRSLARSFTFLGKIDAQDVEQELSMVLWSLSQRVDPERFPDDFRKLVKTEMKNRGIDLFRHWTAKKRSAIVGEATECLRCGTITQHYQAAIVVCRYCGNPGEWKKDTPGMRWVTLRASDVQMDTPDQEEAHPNGTIGIEVFEDRKGQEPIFDSLSRELVRKIRDQLPDYPERALLDIYLSPPPAFLRALSSNGYPADSRKAPYWLLSQFLGVSEKCLRAAYTRVCVVTAYAVDRPDLLDTLSTYNLSQIDLES